MKYIHLPVFPRSLFNLLAYSSPFSPALYPGPHIWQSQQDPEEVDWSPESLETEQMEAKNVSTVLKAGLEGTLL